MKPTQPERIDGQIDVFDELDAPMWCPRCTTWLRPDYFQPGHRLCTPCRMGPEVIVSFDVARAEGSHSYVVKQDDEIIAVYHSQAECKAFIDGLAHPREIGLKSEG